MLYKTIVTVVNSDGSYNEVGMNTRTLVHGTQKDCFFLAKDFAKGKSFRLEFFNPDRFYAERPLFTKYVN